MPEVELVIWDCDGVLVDSERLVVRTESAILATLGWPLSEAEIIERFVGRSAAYMHQEIEHHLGRQIDWESEFEARHREVFERELRPVDGVEEALERIGIPGCVASSGTHQKIRFSLGLAGLASRFQDRIFSIEDVSRGKPAPDLFLFAAHQLGVDPGRMPGGGRQCLGRGGGLGGWNGRLCLLRRSYGRIEARHGRGHRFRAHA